MGKKAKEHRKKVQSRNEKISQDRVKIEKMKRNFIMDLIEKEKERGVFENNQTVGAILPEIEGPSI